MKGISNFDMSGDKINLIYSMLLNIKDGVNKVTDDFNISNPDWEELLTILSECEAEMVYILENIKNRKQ